MKIARTVQAALLLASIGTLPSGALGPNLLLDPGFNTTLAELRWELAQGDGFGFNRNLLTPDLDQVPSDFSLSALVEYDQPPATYTMASQCVENIAAGQSYTFHAYTRNAETFGVGYAQIAVVWHDQAGCQGNLGAEVRQDNEKETWTFLEGTAIAPPTAQSATVALRIKKETDENSDAVLSYFDTTYFGMTSSCAPSGGSVCIQDRFLVSLTYDTVLGGGASGEGTGLDLSPLGIDQGALFWIFDPANPEVLVKVLDACGFTNTFWVFVSAGTNVGFELEIVDVEQNLEWTVANPDQLPFESVQDLAAFSCP